MLAQQAALEEEQQMLRREQEENRRERERRLADGEATVPHIPPQTTLEAVAARRNRLLVVVDTSPVLFKDVPLDAWFSPYVSYLVEEKIAQGYHDVDGNPNGVFGVANPVTYAEVLKMALAAAKIPVTGLPPPRNTFARGTWAAAYVAKAEAQNIPLILPDLDVHGPATRAEVVAILLNVLDLPVAPKAETDFTDIPANHPYAKAIATAYIYGLVQGNPDGTFRPDDPINRAEVAKLVGLLLELRSQ